MTEELKLRECPFCGQTPDIAHPYTFQSNQGTKWGYVVCCCNGPEVRTGYGPVEEWRADAIAAWNHRTPSPEVIALVGAARQMRDWWNDDPSPTMDECLAKLAAALVPFKEVE